MKNSHKHCDARRSLFLFCNAIKAIVTKKGNLKGYATVRFHPEDIANILSFSNVQKKHNVTYDSTLNQGFLLHKADGTTRLFRLSKKGYSSLMLKMTLDTSLLIQ